MLATQHRHDPVMRDLEQELVATIASRHSTEGEPLDGLFNLTRRMENEDEDQFDVDLTILDFLVYKAVALVFEWQSSADPYQSDLPSALVTMTGDWRLFLSHRHHGRRLGSTAALRSRLLQFSLVLTHRFHPVETWTTEESLNALREQNARRGQYWQQRTSHPPAVRQPFDTAKEFPLSDAALLANRNQLNSALGIPTDQSRWVTDIPGTTSLMCLLPLFLELSAARAILDDDWVPTSEWFELAGEFMLQAVVEEYLLNGSYGEEVFNALFAVGCPGVGRWAGEGSDVTAMRRLFCDENDSRRQLESWTSIKEQHIKELTPQGTSVSSLQVMERARQRHPYRPFENRLLSFLKHLHDGLPKPDLVQVEEGRINIDGNEFSEEDSRKVIQRMGL